MPRFAALLLFCWTLAACGTNGPSDTGIENHPPVADAGAGQTVHKHDTVTLDGSGSSDPDGDSLTYSWTQTSGTTVTLDDAHAEQPTFAAPDTSGDLAFELIVNDARLDSTASQVVISVLDQAPTADAGDDQQVDADAVVTLDASGSTDPDDDPLTFAWTQTSGPEVSLDDPTAEQPTFTSPALGTAMEFSVTVSDGEKTSDPASVLVTVRNQPPVADAGTDRQVAKRAEITLDGSASSDPEDDPLTYAWTQISGQTVTLSDATAAQPTFTSPGLGGTLVFGLIVSDDHENSSPQATVTVTVQNQAPVADAGTDVNVEGSTVVTLDGSGSSDPDGDAITYAWTQVSGPSVTLDDPTAQKPTFTAPVAHAALVFGLVVSDGEISSDQATVGVGVANHPPVADAGSDQSVHKGDRVHLDGTGSSDADNDTLTFAWTQLAGPSVTLDDSTAAQPAFTAPATGGDVVLGLVVHDGAVNSDQDVVTITVVNRAPVADAGPDADAYKGAQVTLDATGSSDPDDDTLTYTWTQVSGTTVTLSDTTAAQPAFDVPTTSGALVFGLLVSDGEASSSLDTVTITVVDRAPVADAGTGATVNKGVQVTLDAMGSSDPDATDTLTFAWTQIAGTDVALTGADTAEPSFTTPLASGDLVFQVEVTDDDGQFDQATVTITVINRAPVADAGTDFDTFRRYADSQMVALDGTGSSDPDGANQITGWTWTQVSGPTVALTNADTATPTFFPPDAAGDVTLQLVVNDGEDDSAPDTVVVHVLNQGPTAVASVHDADPFKGALVTLSGLDSTDPEGDALTYAWTQISGAAASLSDTTAAEPTFTAPNVTGDLVFGLVVDDGTDSSSQATVTIHVHNNPPVAVANGPAKVAKGTTVTLDGTASHDPDGQALTYSWAQDLDNHPDQPAVTLSDPTAAKPTFTAPWSAGPLFFTLTVSDGETTSAPAAVSLEVFNQVPVANAGTDQVGVGRNTAVTLDGSGSTDADTGDTLTYAWTPSAPPQGCEAIALTGADSAKPQFIAPPYDKTGKPYHNCTYTISLVVSDGDDPSMADTVQVTVKDQAPIAAASAVNADPYKGETVTLDGSGSSDPDGAIDTLSYTWTRLTDVAIFDFDTNDPAHPTFTAPRVSGPITYQLVVSDGVLTSAPTTVSITVHNHVPVANAGADFTIDRQTIGDTIEAFTLDGTGSTDADGPLPTNGYTWTYVSGPLPTLWDPNTENTSNPVYVRPKDAGDLVFSLVVNDGEDDSAPDTVVVHVVNQAPTAVATVTGTSSPFKGDTVYLSGASSSDPEGDPLDFTWTQESGTAVTLSSTTAVQPSFTAPNVTGPLVFGLVVSDGTAQSAKVKVTVNVQNHPPVAEAGGPVSVLKAETGVTLDGSVSYDVDNQPLTYGWSQDTTNYPKQPVVTLTGADTAKPTFTAPTVSGDLHFVLVVNDGEDDSPPYPVTVPVVDQAPVADAGPDQNGVFRNVTITLDGSGSSDPDASDSLTYAWSAQAPSSPCPAVSLSGVNTAHPTFLTPSFDVQDAVLDGCKYVFGLVVDDGEQTSPVDFVQVVVNDRRPVAEPALGKPNPVYKGDLVTLDGTASYDPDDVSPSDPLTYDWSTLLDLAITDAYTATPSFTAPNAVGDYVFTLQVSDPILSSQAVDLTVHVNNHVPVADAGADLSTWRDNPETMLQGSGTDQDAVDQQNLTYKWTQTGGTSVTLSSDTVAQPWFTTPSVTGDLTFQLVVSDGDDTSAADTVVVHVTNRAPVASAIGPGQMSVLTKGLLDGSGSYDPDRMDSLSFNWTQLAGTPVMLSNATASKTTFIAPPTSQTLQFELVVSDGSLTDIAYVNVNVLNTAPVADAGSTINANGGEVIWLDASGSYDPEGGRLSYAWKQTYPSPGNVQLADPTSPVIPVKLPNTSGKIEFQVTVSDGEMSSTAKVAGSVHAYAGQTAWTDQLDDPFRPAPSSYIAAIGENANAIQNTNGGALTIRDLATGSTVSNLGTKEVLIGQQHGVAVTAAFSFSEGTSLTFWGVRDQTLVTLATAHIPAPCVAIGDIAFSPDDQRLYLQVEDLTQSPAAVDIAALDITPLQDIQPSSPPILGYQRLEQSAHGIAADNEHVYVTQPYNASQDDLWSFDTTQLGATGTWGAALAIHVCGTQTSTGIFDVIVRDKTMYGACSQGLAVLDLSSGTPQVTWRLPEARGEELTVHGDILVIGAPTTAIYAVDLSSGAPKLVGVMHGTKFVNSLLPLRLQTSGSWTYWRTTGGLISSSTVVNPPTPAASVSASHPLGLTAKDGLLLLGSDRTEVYDVTQPAAPSLLTTLGAAPSGRESYALRTPWSGLVGQSGSLASFDLFANTTSGVAERTSVGFDYVRVAGQQAIVGSDAGLEVVDLDTGALSTYGTSAAQGLAIVGDTAWATWSDGSLQSYPLSDPTAGTSSKGHPFERGLPAYGSLLATGAYASFSTWDVSGRSASYYGTTKNGFGEPLHSVGTGSALLMAERGGLGVYVVGPQGVMSTMGHYASTGPLGGVTTDAGWAWAINGNSGNVEGYDLRTARFAQRYVTEPSAVAAPVILSYQIFWSEPSVGAKVLCLATDGTVSIINVDPVKKTATFTWTMPAVTGGYEIACAVGDDGTYTVLRDRVNVQ